MSWTRKTLQWGSRFPGDWFSQGFDKVFLWAFHSNPLASALSTCDCASLPSPTGFSIHGQILISILRLNTPTEINRTIHRVRYKATWVKMDRIWPYNFKNSVRSWKEKKRIKRKKERVSPPMSQGLQLAVS